MATPPTGSDPAPRGRRVRSTDGPRPARRDAPTAVLPTVEAAPNPPGRSKGKVIGAAVGAVAIVAAGAFAITRLTGDSASGGASSPEAAGEAFLAAIDNEDVLGMIDVLLPGEREYAARPGHRPGRAS